MMNRSAPAATIVPISNGRARVKLDIPQRAITPGQATIFYNRHFLFKESSGFYFAISDMFSSSFFNTGSFNFTKWALALAALPLMVMFSISTMNENAIPK